MGTSLGRSTAEGGGEQRPPAASQIDPSIAAGDALPLTADERRAFFQREAEALREQQPERCAAMWIEAASADEHPSNPEAIIEDIEQALAAAANVPWLYERARRLFMQHGCYEQALQRARRGAGFSGDSAARAAALFELAGMLLYRFGRADAALQLTKQALKLHPHSVMALTRVVALAQRAGAHVKTVEGLHALSNLVVDPQDRASLLYAAATLQETQLDEPKVAEVTYQRALELAPAHIPTLHALCELYERHGNWSALCRSLERMADLSNDVTLRGRLCHRAGVLHLDLTGDLDAACRLLSRAAREMPDDAVVWQRLADAHELRGQPHQRLQALRQLLSHTAEGQARAALLTQIAIILKEQLHDSDSAIAAYRQALEEIPGYLPALQSLATIYRQRGDHEGLIAIANPEVEGTLPPEARAVRYIELAETLERDASRLDDAANAYRRALELAPTLHLAFWGLESLLRRRGCHDELAELLAAHAAICADPQTRAQLLLQRGRLQADALGNVSGAVETLRQALGEGAAGVGALELIDLVARAGRGGDHATLLLQHAETTTDRLEADGRRIQAARVLERLDEQDRALQIFRDVLAGDPGNMAAVHGVGRILHRQGEWTALVQLHEHELAHQPGRSDAATLQCRVGRILAEKLGDHAAAIDAYARALSIDPAYTPALVALEHLARVEHRWNELVTVLENFAQGRSDSAAAAALYRAAQIAGWQLGDIERATKLFEAAQRCSADTSRVNEGLLRLHLRQRQWAAAAALLPAMIETAQAPEERALLQLSLARLREHRLGEGPDLTLYQQAASSPLGEHLRDELTRVARLVDGEQLASWLVETAARVHDGTLAASHLVDAAQLCEFAGDAEEALAPSELACERSPTEPAAIWSLERALFRHSRWGELGALREREAQLEIDRGVRAHGLARAAIAYWLAQSSDEAARVSREALNLDARYLPALLQLAFLAMQRQDWVATAELCDRLAEACNAVDNRSRLCLYASLLWEQRVGDPVRALASLLVVLADSPAEPATFANAERLLIDRGDIEELSRLYQRAIRACREAPRRAALLRRHAALLCDKPRDRQRVDRAIAELNALLTLCPDDADAMAELAALQCEQQYWFDGAATLDRLIEQTSESEQRHRARIELARLWLQRLHEPERARAVLEAARVDRPDDLDITKLELELAMAVGRWEDARTLLEGVAEHGDGETRMWANLQLAQIARVGLRDGALGDRRERAALRQAASEPETLAALRSHYAERPERLRLVELAEELLGESSKDDASALRDLIARISVEDLAQPERALPYLRELLELRPESIDGRLLFARALEQQGRGVEAVAQYRALLEIDAANVAAYRGLVRVCNDPIGGAAAAVLAFLGAAGPAEQPLLAKLGGGSVSRRSLSPEPPAPEKRERALQEVLLTLLPFAEQLYATTSAPELEPTHPAVIGATQLAGALGFGPLRVMVASGDLTATVAIGRPLQLHLGGALIEQSDTPMFRFWVARTLVRAFGGATLLRQLDPEALQDLFSALRDRRSPSPPARELRKTLARVVPRKARRHLAELASRTADPELWQRYQRRLDRWADRLALVLCHHPTIGLQQLTASYQAVPEDAARVPDLAQLMRFVVSEEYARLYRAVWS